MILTAWEISVRLGLAVLFGALIGVERQWHHKTAGVKTHTLTALGATAFSLVSVLGLGPNSVPTQLAVGVATGIGFIGGGVIMHRGASVQGITTAATLWTTASLGLALGAGYYVLSFTLVVGILVVQLLLPFADTWIERRSPYPVAPTHLLLVVFEPRSATTVRAKLDSFQHDPCVRVFRSSEGRAAAELLWELRLGLNPEGFTKLVALGRELTASEGVRKVEWSALEHEV